MTESIPGQLPSARASIQPSAGKLLIRSVQTPETLAHGKIVLTQKTREDWTWGQMEVISIGAPAYCDDPDCERPHTAECGDHGEELERRHPITIKPGDWILIKPRAASETHLEGLYVCMVEDVLAVLTTD